MADKAVFGLVSTASQLENIIEQLRTSGFSNNDISVLYPDSTGAHQMEHKNTTKAPEGAATGAGTGGAIGAALGWLVGIGSLAIPGLGPFIAAGPIMAALSGAAVGAAVGGLTGALVGMGVPEYEAKLYEGKLKQGKMLVSVHTDDGDQRDRVKDIFKISGVEDIGVAGEVTVKA